MRELSCLWHIHWSSLQGWTSSTTCNETRQSYSRSTRSKLGKHSTRYRLDILTSRVELPNTRKFIYKLTNKNPNVMYF